MMKNKQIAYYKNKIINDNSIHNDKRTKNKNVIQRL